MTRGLRILSLLFGVALVLGAHMLSANASGNPGQTLQQAAAGSDQEKKDFAKCICEIIDGVPDVLYPACLPQAQQKLASDLKQANCIKIAGKSEWERNAE